MSRKIQFGCLFVLLGLLSTATQLAFAQPPTPPLNFGNNFFVTGDYIVAGAYGMMNFTTVNNISYAMGTINVPDKNPKGVPNPGITGATSVPPGAQVVAALLYWQTVEKVGVAPGAPGSGQNGYFRPMFSGGPAAPGYAISGSNVSGSNTVSWSSGGCNGNSSGKLLRTYRADVAGGLPVDANGNSIANGSFQVLLPSTGNSTPLTLGATLVVIYRILSGAGGPTIPLNSIVIYDGDYAQGNAQLTMTQQLQGFYDAAKNPVSRLTHIVGNGKSNKFQTVYLSSGANSFVALQPLYGKQLPAFPGWYGTWDNTTWTFTNASNTNPGILEDASYATTQVVPFPSNQGCVSWGAVIVSTTVKNSDNDGILDSWKTNQGYCDVALNPSCTAHVDPAWVDLPGANNGQRDVFLQYDYMCSSVTGPGSCDISTQRDTLSAASAASGGKTTYTGTFSPSIPAGTVVGIAGFTNQANNGQFTVVSDSTGTQLIVNNPSGVAETNPGLATYAKPGDVNYSFDPRLAIDTEDGKFPHDNAVDKVVEAYAKRGITLHAFAGNAILEGGANNPVSCADTDPTCTFPNEPGTIGFREGLAYIKNTNILTSTGVIGGCTVGTDAGCEPVFQHGKKDSYHYALFSHGVGLPSWFLSDGSLVSAQQSGNTVTFTTSSPHGISQILAQPGTGATGNDNSCLLGRVTVIFAITNSNLEGTFCVLSSPAPTANTFSITVGGNATNFNYTSKTDPNLSVANGQVTSMSGYSDVGGQNSVISLGYGGWAPPNNPFSEGNKWQVKAGTFMHELGHTMALTHGGTFYNNLQNNPVDYTPNFEVNCKPNVQTSMSYLFQFDLLKTNGLYANNQPIKVVDYSNDPQPLKPQLVNTLTESSPQDPGFLSNLTYPNTSWFQLTSYNGATAATSHCDGSPAPPVPSYSYINDAVSNFFWSNAAGLDVNFNGSTTDVMDPHNEWEGTPAQNGVGPSPGIDLLQISAVGTVSTTGVGGEAGGLKPQGGGGGLKPQGGGGGLKPQGGGGGLHPAGGGGGLKPQGGGGLKAEITHGQANSYAHPPEGLFIVQEEASPRFIDLTWFSPTIGAVVQYNVYRSDAGGTFVQKGSVPGSQTTFQDTVTCNPAGYHYRVTAVTLNDQGGQQTSSPSNTVPAFGQKPLTGCYTITNFSVPANAVQGNTGVQISWTLADDFFTSTPSRWDLAFSGNPVTRQAANTLVAIGPQPGNCTNLLYRTTLVADGNPTQAGTVDNGTVDAFASATNNFTFTWNRTDAFCAGQYTFELDLDHVNGAPAQTQSGPNALQLAIDINDQDTPRINTLPLPAGVVGKPYTDTLTEDGGTAPFTWTVTGLPSGISQQPPNSPTLSGTTCVAGSYNVNATVTDSKSNSGSQAFTLQINQANTTTGVASNPNPSVFQQMVTFTVTVAPQYSCTPTGTVTLSVDGAPVGSNALTSGAATFSLSNLSVGMHSITASYGGDSNFNASNNNSTPWLQTVNKANTGIVFNSLLTSPPFVGQPITVSYTFSVVAPGAGSPIAPTGNIMLTASDGSSCAAAPTLGGGMCTLSPAPTTAGDRTFTITYSGDGNFLASGANGNHYTVYQLVFTTQPSNTGVGLTITPAVAVTAEDSSNATLGTFTGSITLAIGSGPGALSGTTTQNAVSGVVTFAGLSINKIANGYTLTASPLGGVPDATSNAFNVDTFYVDGNGNFGTLDLPTGTVTQISATVPGSNGIDLTPGLQVYAYNTSNQLMQITPSTGAATTIGTGTLPNPTNTKTGALTTGSYFAIDNVTGNLYSIDLSSGATTPVGPTSTTLVPAGCAFEASLAGSTNTLYYTIGSQGGTGCPAFTDTLYAIDPTTGNIIANVPITVGGSPVNGFVGSAFVNGTLYGFTADGHEYSIDPATGMATLLKSTTPSIVGAGGS